MKRWTLRGVLILALLAAGGFLVAASGIIPIKASSGHWAVTEWFLQFSMRRSIATHSIGVKVPELDNAALAMRGAGHYETGCRSCHGAPGTPQPTIARAMTPKAPKLGERIRESNPKKLFHVVKHGLKFTGMPAWPSQERDDEVWAMVAFLLALPELDADGYRRLVHGDPSAVPPMQTMPGANISKHPGAAAAQACARCHGTDGRGRGDGAFPRLAGQRRDYLANALHAYASGDRHSGIMEPVAASLTDDLIQNLATYYAELDAGGAAEAGTATEMQAAEMADEELERGKTLALAGDRRRRLPACVECHGPKGTRTKPAYPSIAGMSAFYLEGQLKLFKEQRRGGSAYAHVMEEVAERLEEADMRAVARYFASLPAGVSETAGRTNPP